MREPYITVKPGEYFFFKVTWAKEPLLALCTGYYDELELAVINYIHPDGKVVIGAYIPRRGRYTLATSLDVLEARLKGFDL